MAFEKPLLIQSFTAASDITATTALYTFVKLTTDSKVIACASTTDFPIGVLQNLPSQGQLAEVMILGISKVRVSATDITSVTAGYLGVDAQGRGVLLTPGTSTASFVLGRVLEVEAADNDGALLTCAVNCINLNRAL